MASPVPPPSAALNALVLAILALNGVIGHSQIRPGAVPAPLLTSAPRKLGTGGDLAGAGAEDKRVSEPVATWELPIGRGIPQAKLLPGGGRLRASLSAPGGGPSETPRQAPTVAAAVPSNAGYSRTEEVVAPIPRPAGITPCTVNIITQQNFSSFTDVNVSYAPPSACASTWQLVVITLSSQITGTQYDRRFTITLDSLAVLIGTTAEPIVNPGTIFSVERNVTALSSFLRSPRAGVVSMQNPISANEPGIYYVNVTLQFYPGPAPGLLPNVVVPLPNGSFSAPNNTYKALVEIYVSHYSSDEFYYTYVPTSYYNSLNANQKQFQPLYGTAFREVIAYLDGAVVGIVFPKPLFYSGAFDPLLWAPFMGIGSLSMPLYTLDVTPFVPMLLDGKRHFLNFSVSNASKDATWVTSGSLQLWTDPVLNRTSGALANSQVSSNGLTETISAKGTLNSNLVTAASRTYNFSGFVVSSLGNLTTTVAASLTFSNKIALSQNGYFETITHNTTAALSAVTSGLGYPTAQMQSSFGFPATVRLNYIVQATGAYTRDFGVSHSVVALSNATTSSTQTNESLKNVQAISSKTNVNKYGYVTSYSATGSQNYTSQKAGPRCYRRNVASNWQTTTGSYVVTKTLDSSNSTC